MQSSTNQAYRVNLKLEGQDLASKKKNPTKYENSYCWKWLYLAPPSLFQIKFVKKVMNEIEAFQTKNNETFY